MWRHHLSFVASLSSRAQVCFYHGTLGKSVTKKKDFVCLAIFGNKVHKSLILKERTISMHLTRLTAALSRTFKLPGFATCCKASLRSPKGNVGHFPQITRSISLQRKKEKKSKTWSTNHNFALCLVQLHELKQSTGMLQSRWYSTIIVIVS